MANKPRPPASQFADLILLALRASRRPLAAVELIEAVRKHRPAFQSQVFRELRRLRRNGAIRKINIAKGYAPDGNTRQISLACGHCGELTGLPSDASFDALDSIALARNFRPGSYVVEVAGVCKGCCAKTS